MGWFYTCLVVSEIVLHEGGGDRILFLGADKENKQNACRLQQTGQV